MAENTKSDSQSLFGRILNSIRNRNKQRAESAFLASLPTPYADFFKRYKPKNEKDAELFNKTKGFLMSPGFKVKHFSEELAELADAPLLRHLWIESKANEPDLRKVILENPSCPKEIALFAVADPFPDVAVPAIMNPALSELDLLHAVNRVDRSSPGAVQALEDRLEDLGYRIDWNPWVTREEDLGKPKIYKVLENGNEVPLDKNFNFKKHSSLDNIISDAQQRSEAQAKTRSNVPVKDFTTER